MAIYSRTTERYDSQPLQRPFPGVRPGPDRFCLGHKLGRGSMGVIYSARCSTSGQEVAVKFPCASTSTSVGDGEETLARISFENEIRAASRLHHPNIIRVLGVGRYHGRPYLMMEMVSGGKSLKHLLASDCEATLSTRLGWVYQCAVALGHIWDKKIVHRDVKPSNILIDACNNIKLIDFGVAEFQEAGNCGPALIAAGSARYMSPEQIHQAPLDGRSDIFSLGLILAEVILGFHPFGGTTIGAAKCKILTQRQPALTLPCAKLSRLLNEILNRALAKLPQSRYGSAYAFAGDLALAYEIAKARERRLSALN